MTKKPARYLQHFFLLTLLILLIPGHSLASINKKLWPIWEVNNPLSKEKISHHEWQAFLSNCVTTNSEGLNLIDYAHLNASDKALVKKYIERMSKINIDNFNRNEQLAYWLNLYNALIVDTVIRYYPVGTIQDIKISPGLFSVGPWGTNLVKITNTPLSLDDIHNRIIRPVWNDPRTHYALNNGTLGAANISKKAYAGECIDEQLNERAYDYINSLRAVQVIEGKLIVSKIYEWYAEDFGGNLADTIDHIKQFAKEPLRSQLKHINTIEGYVYNWHINALISSRS